MDIIVENALDNSIELQIEGHGEGYVVESKDRGNVILKTGNNDGELLINIARNESSGNLVVVLYDYDLNSMELELIEKS